MEITARRQGEPPRELFVHRIPRLSYLCEIESVIRTRMRSPHHVRDSIGDGIFRHSHRLFDGFCAVIESGKYMRM